MNIFKELEKYDSNISLYSDTSETITYREMLKQADKVGENIKSRSLVFILGKNDVDSIIGYVGVLRSNSVVLILDNEIKSIFLNNLLEKFKPHFIYSSKKKFDIFSKENSSLQNYEKVFDNNSYVLIKTNFNIQYSMNPKLALLLTTSGSTGAQKFVRQSYENIYSNTKSIAKYLNIKSSNRPITTLPFGYTFGLSIIHSHFLKGASVILTETSILQKEFWETCEKFKATTFSGVPYTFEMLKKLKFEEMDLLHLRYLTQAGGKLEKSLCKFFAETCEQKNMKFIVMYGQTEATARMSYLPWEHAISKSGSIGIVIPGGKFYLKDADGNIIDKPNVSGELIYEGDNVTLGYAQNYSDLSKSDENNGVLHTGDIAKRDEEGFYYIVGRLKRFLKIFGKRVNLDEIEVWLRKNGYDCACVGTDNNLILFTTNKEDEQKISELLTKNFNINKIAFNIKHIDKIPRNNSNKIQYSLLK